MAAVVRLCPSVCESSHFAVLLGAYGATLSVVGEDVTRACVGTKWVVGPGRVWGLGRWCDQGVCGDQMV